ncbi:MAG: cell division topological specificity factor MinE [Desulfobacterales bacterium]|nr:cell division topological specificity factor MinE [Desulfobacterales bacterium]MCP4159534.1 cell division topological specificity factor MinE [Deltaproteobacteria bacterium]
MIYGLLNKRNKKTSKDIAKSRLKNTLICDRVAVSEDLLISLKDEIYNVVSGYFEIDKEAFKVKLKKEKHPFSLVFNMPILSNKRNTNRA